MQSRSKGYQITENVGDLFAKIGCCRTNVYPLNWHQAHDFSHIFTTFCCYLYHKMGCQKTETFNFVVASSQSLLANKLVKISSRSKSYNRLNKNWDNSSRNKSSWHKAKSQIYWRENCFNSRTSKFNY